MRRTSIAVLLAAAACGAQTKQQPPVAEPPGWFSTPPKSPRMLFFVGDATQAPDEGTARDLAIQKALHNLSVYCGAKITSEAQSMEREVNGQLEQAVSMTVDLEGEQINIQEATVKQVVVQAGSAGGYDGYVLVEWPRAQYEAVLAAQRNRALRALAKYEEAAQATERRELGAASAALREAKELLGSSVAVVGLDDAEIRDTAVLRNAMTALGQKIDALAKEMKNVCAVGVRCVREGKPTDCSSSRLGAIRQVVTRAGRKVASSVIPADVVGAIVASGSPQLDAGTRSASCVVAVQFTADLLEQSNPFVYIRYGARGVVFDTESGRILHSHEVEPTKLGHVSFDGAMQKGFDQAEKVVVDRLAELLGDVK